MSQFKVDVQGDRVALRDSSGKPPWLLEAEDAWDLGDDLTIAADRLMFRQVEEVQAAVVEPPAWISQVSVAILGWRLSVVCAEHGVIQYPGSVLDVGQVMNKAREHWAQQHSAQVHDDLGH